MAKKGGKSKGYISEGVHSNVAQSTKKLTTQSETSRLMNQLDAFKKGKNVVLTIDNPNKAETNKPFIKVNAKTFWKNPSAPGYSMR